jgi:hypothetical protein
VGKQPTKRAKIDDEAHRKELRITCGANISDKKYHSFSPAVEIKWRSTMKTHYTKFVTYVLNK